MRALPLVFAAALASVPAAHAQSLHSFCAAGSKQVQSDNLLGEALRAQFGQVDFISTGDECIYPLKALRYAAADVLLTQGNVPGEACHGCGARLSAYVLRRIGGELRPVAHFIDFAETGTFGIAGEITPLTIGGDDGLVIESGGTFQGITSTGLELYVFRAGRVTHLVANPPISTGAGNGGSTTDGGKVISVDGSWSVAPFPGNALAVDYKIKARGHTRVERAVWTLDGSRMVLTQGHIPPEIRQAGG